MSGSDTTAPTTEVRAFLVGKVDGAWSRRIGSLTVGELGEGEVLVRVERSGINFKDGLASTESGRVARIDPLIPGIDLAGTVVASDDPAVAVGSSVVAHGYDLGVAHHGGYAELARVRSGWVVPMPAGLDATTAMMVGTAGYTAALSVVALEHHGLRPGSGPVLVTGATGGVGSMAVGMLAALGHEVVASTGKADAADWLRSLGASDVIDRTELTPESSKPLERERWAGAVDCVGGATLGHVLRTTRYGGAVAASGLTGGADLPTSVHPFILRGVSLLGIDSVQTAIGTRRDVWQRIAGDLKPSWLESEQFEVTGLGDLPGHLDRILAGDMRGRVLVDPSA
jgi:acrylyl-CoA reductase (NADPH)